MNRIGRSILVAFAAGVVACGSGQDGDSSLLSPHAAGTPVDVTRIEVNPGWGSSLTDQGGYDTARRLVITGPAAWATEWARIWASHDPLPALPVVDFSREFVVVAASGTRGSGGYQVEVSAAAIADGVLRIAVVEILPAATCAVATVRTSPVSAARIPNFSGAIEFVEYRSERICPP